MNSSPSYIIEKLGREHDLKAFDCGTPSLTAWLNPFAWQNQQADSVKVYVAVTDNRVAGYYALTAGSVIEEQSPARIAKGLRTTRLESSCSPGWRWTSERTKRLC